MLRKFFTLVITLILLVVFTPRAFAIEDPLSPRQLAGRSGQEFATSYDVIYDISDTGITTVTEKVVLKNLTSQFYATQFKLTIGATQLTDIVASDPAGPMQVDVESKDTSTTLSVKFNQQVAGIDKTLPWTLQFKSKDFATKLGKVWEISVPKVVSSANLENYNLTLVVPTTFGATTIISPNPKSQSSQFGKNYFTFDKDQLINSGISASFGSNQIYDFDLTYNLENKTLLPVLTTIALPPDTAYQDVIFQRIDPQPLNVTVDDDGNYLAWYKLLRNEKKVIKVIGSAKLYSRSKVKKPTLSPSVYKKYLESSKYWEKDHPTVKAKLDEILGANPPKTNYDKAKLIHRFVVNFLQYDAGRLNNNSIERFGAVIALTNPANAVCMEFTDLFIALTRAAGIPSRELNGFAYTSNNKLRPLSLSKDILHAWPEYYDDQKGWVMVDPTWENTTSGVDYFDKLDLNHFVFVVKGLSSDQPIPAGSYKFDGIDSHDVKVNLSNTDFLGKPQINVSIENPNPILAGFPAKIKVKFSNAGNAVKFSEPFTINSIQTDFFEVKSQEMGIIPAFGFAQFDFELRTKSLLDSFDDNIEVKISGQKSNKDVQIRPLIIFQTFPFVLAGAVLGVVLFYLLILLTMIYRRRIKARVDGKS